jgi:hypothetical protein
MSMSYIIYALNFIIRLGEVVIHGLYVCKKQKGRYYDELIF